MFPESSTWQADIVRVTDDGQRIPITEPWAGYRWARAGRRPRACEPRRAPPRRCRARTTSWRSSTPPSTGWPTHAARHRDAVPRGGRDDVAQHRRPERGRAAQPTGVASDAADVARRSATPSARRAARAAGEHARDGPAARARRADRAAPPAAVPPRAWTARIYRDTFHEPYASWYPELPRAAVRRRAVDRRPSPRWR